MTTIKQEIRGLLRPVVTPIVAITVLVMAAPATLAQSTSPQGGPELHLFAAEDFGIDPTEVTFTEDIAPILQRSCVRCHREGGGGPMALTTYEQARPWAPVIKYKTAIRDRMGAMPPWYVEKDIGIQHYKQDPSLSDEELAKIQAWADNGAPQGDPSRMPELATDADEGWTIEPDLVVRSQDIFMAGGAPDWWGEIDPIPIPLEEDRYVRSVEIREVNDVPSSGTGRQTVGGRWIVHHLIYRTQVPGETREDAIGWPVHEVGRNPDLFSPESGRLLKAGSEIRSESAHLHSTGIDTTGHLEFAFEFFPPDYTPKYEEAGVSLGDGLNISVAPNANEQELHAYRVLQDHVKIIAFEPHLHAPGDRMCLEAIWDRQIETLSCVGYDHNWVRTYTFAENYEPLLPKGTIVHITGFMDNTRNNFNIPDPRNWQGSGNRSVTNMFIDLGIMLRLSDEEFVEEMAKRRETLNLDVNDHVIGCPLCMARIPRFENSETASGVEVEQRQRNEVAASDTANNAASGDQE